MDTVNLMTNFSKLRLNFKLNTWRIDRYLTILKDLLIDNRSIRKAEISNGPNFRIKESKSRKVIFQNVSKSRRAKVVKWIEISKSQNLRELKFWWEPKFWKSKVPESLKIPNGSDNHFSKRQSHSKIQPNRLNFFRNLLEALSASSRIHRFSADYFFSSSILGNSIVNNFNNSV